MTTDLIDRANQRARAAAQDKLIPPLVANIRREVSDWPRPITSARLPRLGSFQTLSDG